MELFEPLAKDKQLSLVYQTKIKEELMLDYTTVKTILNNLVSNAIKYSIPFIFDRFFQVDRSRSKKLGTGLGLSIVKKMVELNNGTIDVESTPGIGTTFTVTLPIL